MLVGAALMAVGLVYMNVRPASVQALVAPAAESTPALTQGAPQVGALAPDFTLRGLDQKNVRLSQLRGKPVMVNFWATWCGPCSAEMPNIEKVYEKYPNGDFAVLAVNQGEYADQVSGYADLYHLHFPILLDEKAQVARVYRVQALPTTVFIDRDGIVREIHIGGPMTTEFIEKEILTLLGKTP